MKSNGKISKVKEQIQISERSMERHTQKIWSNPQSNKFDGSHKNEVGLEPKKVKYILNLGAGVNSTALLIYLVNNNLPLDEVIFADTGAEMPETYNYLPKIMKFCLDNKIKFTIVNSHLGTLKGLCKERQMIPSRMYRWCTDKFKIRPINKHLGSTELYIQYFGISYEESHRAKSTGPMKNITPNYPLVELKINRKDCMDIIKNNGWPIPIKSGCYLCPFQTVKAWKHLYENNKDLYLICESLEKNNFNYPKILFRNRPLSSMKNMFGDSSSKLDEWFLAPKCESGYCMT